MQKAGKSFAIAACLAAFASTSYASPVSLPSDDSHPIYFNMQDYRQADSSELAGVFTAKRLDGLVKPSKEALSATSKEADAVREKMKLPEELYLLPLEEKDFRSLSAQEKQAYIDSCYASFIEDTNKLIHKTDDENEKAFYGAAQKLVRDYLLDDTMHAADGKASVAGYFSTHVGDLEAAWNG